MTIDVVKGVWTHGNRNKVVNFTGEKGKEGT